MRTGTLVVAILSLACAGCAVRPCSVRLGEHVPSSIPTQISLGQNHGCARMNSGTVQCWGAADQLGSLARGRDGWDAYRAYPGPGLENVVRVDAGPDTTCALTATGFRQRHAQSCTPSSRRRLPFGGGANGELADGRRQV